MNRIKNAFKGSKVHQLDLSKPKLLQSYRVTNQTTPRQLELTVKTKVALFEISPGRLELKDHHTIHQVTLNLK
jgi:hypothetical protein